jgi:hypothetical protein
MLSYRKRRIFFCHFGGKTMRWTIGLAVGLAAFLAGCDSEVHEQMESEVKTLQTRSEVFRRECDTLKAAVDNLKAENAALERKQYGLGAENDSLKKQVEAERVAAARKVEQLTKDLAAAKRGIAVLSAAPDTAPAATANAAPAPETRIAVVDEASVAAIKETVADLDGRIKALQPKIGQARSNIMGLARATVDQPMVPPPGGKIENGQVYRRDACNDPTHYDYHHYHYAPIGPAVKTGDFRSLKDKEDAIRKAKGEALPMEQELKALQDELAAAKAKLAKIRAVQPAP